MVNYISFFSEFYADSSGIYNSNTALWSLFMCGITYMISEIEMNMK